VDRGRPHRFQLRRVVVLEQGVLRTGAIAPPRIRLVLVLLWLRRVQGM
jgi:hypothetical protein